MFQKDTLEMVGEPVSGMARCPYDPRHANVAVFAGRISHFRTLARQFIIVSQTSDPLYSSKTMKHLFTFADDLQSQHCLFG